MTTRFAGSHSVDDRRRRRLAGEMDEVDSVDVTGTAVPDGTPSFGQSDESEATGLSSGDVRVSHFPVSRLISAKQWKLWAVGLLGLLVGVNLLLAGTSIAAAEQHLGPGFAHLFDLAAGRALKPMATLLLLLASQLAWFIWWVRSRSPHDFDGRYRVWCWCAVIGFAATLTVATDLHLVWAKTALWRWDFKFWQHQIVVWLLPIAFVAMCALRAMHREMRDCRASLTLLWLSATCGVAIAVFQLGLFELPLSTAETRVVCWSTEMAGCWLLFMSLLLHARHVVHVTPDPAQLRKPRFALRSLLRLPRLPKRSPKASEKVKPENKEQATKETVATESEAKSEKTKEATTKPRRRKRASTSVKKATTVETEQAAELPEEPVDRKDSSPEPEASSSKEDKTTSEPPEVATIEMTEPDPMQGLSKRERRRLRKQQKAEKSGRKAA